MIDGKKGFGGAHGIDERAKDASAVGFDYKANVEKHSSQTGRADCHANDRDDDVSQMSFRFFQRIRWKVWHGSKCTGQVSSGILAQGNDSETFLANRWGSKIGICAGTFTY